MTDLVREIELEAMQGKTIPDFSPGDTVVVNVKIIEGEKERLQAFEGIVIAKRNRGLNSSFTVRKISYGEGVERVFQTYSPLIASIKVKRRGKVRRAKLYYLRALSGRAARIKEKIVKKVAKAPKPKVESTPQPLDVKSETQEVTADQPKNESDGGNQG